MSASGPELLARVKVAVDPHLRTAVARIPDERMRLIAQYQMGWCDAGGSPTDRGGKAVRPALAVLASRAVGAPLADGIAGAVAVELVHNFSLLHDDVMDRDVERRHRPTAWVVFGEGQAILAGNAMLTAAIDALVATDPSGRSLPLLLRAIQELISGQSRDLILEGRADVQLDEVLEMEAGKTAALLSCAAAIGAGAAGASEATIRGLAAYGHELGIAFQLVDDVLGVVGDPAATGKSSSSDVRAGKRSAPIVAALRSGGDASRRLGELFAAGPPKTEDDVALATQLVTEAGGLDWARQQAGVCLDRALEQLDRLAPPQGDAAALAELATLARYIVERDR
jgi:geranylgeranyl diphosphate synthase type I